MEVKRTPKIFISYRQKDTSGYVILLHGILTRHYGAEHIFMDIRDMGAGERFVEAFKAEINSSDVFLAVIGKDWLTITDKKRSTNDTDYVGLEIETALARGREIIIIPVLVDGARVPRKQDLPEKLRPLVELNAVELSNRWYERDVNQLIEGLEEALRGAGKIEADVPSSESKSGPVAVGPLAKTKSSVPNSLLSLFGGSLAGLITGTIIGVIYTFERHANLWGLRIILAGLYGLCAGATLSVFINSGIVRCSKLLNNSLYSKIIGGAFGGALGGIVASIAGGLLFALLNGDPVEPIQVVVAVAFSTIFIILGILLPDVKEEWYERLLIAIILVCVTLVTVVLPVWLVGGKLQLEQHFKSPNPVNTGEIILGLICGLTAGVQTGLALFIYYRFKTKSQSTNR